MEKHQDISKTSEIMPELFKTARTIWPSQSQSLRNQQGASRGETQAQIHSILFKPPPSIISICHWLSASFCWADKGDAPWAGLLGGWGEEGCHWQSCKCSTVVEISCQDVWSRTSHSPKVGLAVYGRQKDDPTEMSKSWSSKPWLWTRKHDSEGGAKRTGKGTLQMWLKLRTLRWVD